MELTRRGFIQGAAAGAAVVVAVASVITPAVAAPGFTVPFHQIVGAFRDVDSSETWMSALAVHSFDQFTTQEGDQLSIPKFGIIQGLPPNKVSEGIEARVAVEMDRRRSRAAMFSDNKRRTYFDFGGLMSRWGIIPPRGPTLDTMPPP